MKIIRILENKDRIVSRQLSTGSSLTTLTWEAGIASGAILGLMIYLLLHAAHML